MVQNHLVTFNSEEVENIWTELEPLIKKVLIRHERDYNIEIIKEMLFKKELQLWTSFNERTLEAFVLTHIAIYPNHKICEIFMCGGTNLNNWLGFMAAIEEWAKSLGCRYVGLQGRKGWSRKLAHMGFKQTKIIMRKDLWAEVPNSQQQQPQQHSHQLMHCHI